MIHPIDIAQHAQRDHAAIAQLRADYQADILLFCPLRHDWGIKGTDLNIRALPLLIQQYPDKKIKLLLTTWGNDLEQSKQLLQQLKISEHIVWLEPLCRVKMIRYIQAADVVLDQMLLPCFGSTAPQAIAAGTPVIMSYKPESTAWIIKQPAPILSAFTPAEVAAVAQAIDPLWRQNYQIIAKRWIDDEHSVKRVVLEHLRIYQIIESLA